MTQAQSGSSATPPKPSNDYPESVGRYRIIRRLGEGGMGSVFLAEDTVLRREVALKLPLSGTEKDPQVRERFLREARSAATLDHPYICRVYAADEVDGQPYLAMAYIEGKSLADLIRAEGMPVRQVVALVGKLAIALNEAHLKRVVHRDLKPRNIMIRTAGSKREPVIVDFGLAHLESIEDERITKTGQVLGTPAYMAPEQLLGKLDEIGPACDIYALGVILYELLTGRLPFSGNYAVVVAQILTQPPLPPSTHRSGLDKALDAICLKAMAKGVSKRYASMMELATALTEYLRYARPDSTSVSHVAPTMKPAEGYSIQTGADTLVSRLLKQDDDEAPPLPRRAKVATASPARAQQRTPHPEKPAATPNPPEKKHPSPDERRPMIVTILSLQNLLIGLVDSGLWALLLVKGITDPMLLRSPSFFPISTLLTLNLVASSSLFASGIGLRKGRSWARWTCIAYAIYVFVLYLAAPSLCDSVEMPGARGDMEALAKASIIGMLGGVLPGLIMPSFLLISMMLPGVVWYFHRRPHMVSSTGQP